MNQTLRKFGYPDSVIHEYTHWVVMIRPRQVTLGCVVIASTSDGTSFGDLTESEAAEFPLVVRHFESAVRLFAGAEKFNYLALMMVDLNPHYHAIPRYSRDAICDGLTFRDALFPKPLDVSVAHELDKHQLESIRRYLIEHWRA